MTDTDPLIAMAAERAAKINPGDGSALADLVADLTDMAPPDRVFDLMMSAIEQWPEDKRPPLDELGKAVAWRVAHSARGKDLTQKRSLTGSDELTAHIQAQASGRFSVEDLPFPVLSRESMAGYPGSVVLLCGAPGSAKSWFVLQCLRHWTAVGVAADVLMLEESKAWHLNRLLAQLTQDSRVLDPVWVRHNADIVRLWYSDHKEEIARVGQHLHCNGDVTFQDCCEWVEDRCRAGARILMIDPITLADPGRQKPWDADRKFMTRCKVAIEKSGTTLILVTHPRKANGQSKGPPQMDDLAGGVVYTRAAASVLWMRGEEEDLHAAAMNQSGAIRPVVAHKSLRILKARNSTGTGTTILFSFLHLTLVELGALVKEQKHVPADAPPKRTPRMSTPPGADEDVF